MLVAQRFEELPSGLDASVVTIGTYDGIHLGHQSIIRAVVARAKSFEAQSVVFCFHPPAWKLLGRAQSPFLVTTFEDRCALLETLGVDVVFCIPFTPVLLSVAHDVFIKDYLLAPLKPREVWVGHDFRYGHGRSGNAQLMKEMLSNYGVQTTIVEAVEISGTIASASQVRRDVLDGAVERAAEILGRPHFIRGTIAHGDGRGTTIGFPTANLVPKTELLPPAGVYTTTFDIIDGPNLEGITNIGFRPTFDGAAMAIETHLFDFSDDIYGVEVRLHFHERLRDERRFENVEDLVAQIQLDVTAAQSRRPYPRVGISREEQPR